MLTASGFAVFSHGLTRYKDAQSRFEGSEYGRACPAVIEFSASCVFTGVRLYLRTRLQSGSNAIERAFPERSKVRLFVEPGSQVRR